jgi:hypothetical protein
MLMSGVWYLCDDGVVRPVIRSEVQTDDGSWLKAPLLVDTAADRTVFSADVFRALGLAPQAAAHELSGVGGAAASVEVVTEIRLTQEDGGKVTFRGGFAAFTDPATLDMSVLGRDLTNLFALIVDRPRDVVCLLGQRHQYKIVEE